jgi:hypothetical protein
MLALVASIHVLAAPPKTWIAGTSPAMTKARVEARAERE